MGYVLSLILTVGGGAALIFGSSSSWYNNRVGRTIPVNDLWNGISATSASTMSSVFLPLVIGVALAVIGALLSLKGLQALGALVTVLTIGAYLYQQGQISLEFSRFQSGLIYACVGGLALLLAAVMAPGRRN